MTLASIILALVTLQRLGELVLAHRNTERLLARGAIEVGTDHYPLLVAMHAAWLIALWVYGRDQDVNLIALAVFGVIWPQAVAWPLALITLWIGASLLLRYVRLRKAR